MNQLNKIITSFKNLKSKTPRAVAPAVNAMAIFYYSSN